MTETRTQSHMLDLPDGRFHYLSWGAEREERPAALLLHGITSSVKSWVRVGPALAERYRVYALDMRGHGDSIKPSRGYSLRQTADDALACIDALGLQRPLLLGHSWGGATALVLASGAWCERPAPPFTSVILEDPAHNFGRGDPAKRAASFTRDIGRPTHELRPAIAADNPRWSEADIEGKIDALSKVSRQAVESVFAEGDTAGDLLPLLANICAPTLLIGADAGQGSTLDDAAWERARRTLPARSRAVRIAGATHNVHRDSFDAFMQVVDDFLNTCAATR